MNIEEIQYLREAEDKVEFKQAAAQYNYNNGRRSVLGYIVALANEKGGKLILGVTENPNPPHTISGSQAFAGREGRLEQDIYRDLHIRVQTEVLHEGTNRVLVIHVGSRPVGRYLTFQDVPLMRVGEDLHPMSQDQIRAILLEQESDFSAKLCNNLRVDDLDEKAIQILKTKYAEKQNNKAFLAQSTVQVLTDLDLMREGGLTYAALILLGKNDAISQQLPQCAINLEYRSNPDSIQFDKRDIFTDPYFILVDEIWKIIDARNKKKHIQIGSYIIDIPELNDEVIRESINNAVAHRDYTKASEIVIKQSPQMFSVSSHGGFPLGVKIDNILTVNSTPRNRLLADVLTKTGLVERSGQGVDKIYYQTLSEGKDSPSYEDSDLFQVTVNIPVIVKYPVFALFIRNIQRELVDEDKLGVNHLITLVKIREKEELRPKDKAVLPRLTQVEAISQIKDGVILSAGYTKLVEELEGSDTRKIIEFVSENAPVKMGDILQLFSHRLTRRQVNNMVFKLVEEKMLISDGKGTGTTYSLADDGK